MLTENKVNTSIIFHAPQITEGVFPTTSMTEILEHGQWNGDVYHIFDENLAQEIVHILQDHEINSVVDLGCGDGSYVAFLRENGISCIGFDGNPDVHKLTKGLGVTLDLALPISRFMSAQAVICLEVGEHIPQEFEDTLIDNITWVASDMVVMSWAVPGQGGHGHVNCQTNEHITEQMKIRGFTRREDLEKEPREKCSAPWFKNTFMVFQRND